MSCHNFINSREDVPLCIALQTLKNEHGPLNDQKFALFQEASTILEITSEKEKLTRLQMLRSQAFLFFESLESHAEKEEECLFTMMAAYINRHEGPLAVMEYEHHEAKRCMTMFLTNTESLDTIVTLDAINTQCHLVIEAYHILTSHFLKEEQVLFPMAENLLSDEEKNRLLDFVHPS
ncbi:hemerythrin domain-containing protein [Bacillus sp. 2205SS5-2]|uniref:hemerythrin domain-containing protein n=1 Tax=Bacillus sp. 2205SS5-2 TaxID=3109031 RepID=UPI0030075C8E